MPRWPWDRSEAKTAVPSEPHAFRSIDDVGIAAFANQGGSVESGVAGITSVVVTDNYVRKSRCGVPGCGLERSDPIHQVDAA